MFKQKQKQDKKAKSSKSVVINQIDSYFEKTKSTHFEIYLNSGADEYDIGSTYSTTVSVERCQSFLDSLVKGFSSVYQMDHRAFEWKDKVQSLIKTAKDILKVIDKIKQESKALDERKEKVQNLEIEKQQISDQYNQLKAQFDQLYESSLVDRTNSELYVRAQQRLQHLKKLQVKFSERESELKDVYNQNMALREQNMQLKETIHQLTNRNSQLTTYLDKIIHSSFCPETITQIAQNPYINNQSNPPIAGYTQSKELKQSRFQTQILLNPLLSSIIVSYLPPKSLASLFSLTKTSRFFLLHTPQVIHSIFRSIIGYKEYEISFFHRHINHFQQQMKKIPQQIIQSTFYQFNILKENVGGDFMPILNLCANIFEGKFTPQTTLTISKTVKQYVQSKQIIHYVEQPKEQESFLRIEKSLVEHFFEQRKIKKQQIMKQIQQMTQKITLAQNLYSVDSQTLHQFHQTIIRHFTILFILAKHLFDEARSLQYLNGFVLAELNQITRFKIQKQYDLEDIKAQLHASNNMCLFLSNKCNKSEERILRHIQQNLQTQKHLGKLSQLIKAQQQKVKSLHNQLAQKDLQTTKTRQRHNQLKAAYTAIKQKYNRLMKQLATVKQTILNIT